MTATSLTLSTEGLSRVPVSGSRSDFEFIVGEATYRCPSVIADFLSPVIADLHSMNETISHFVIDTKNSQSDFNSFFGLAHELPVIVTESNREFLESVCKELLNAELYEKITKAVGGELSVANVASRVKCLKEFGGNYKEEIEFLASHFHEISSSDIENLNFEIFAEVIGRPGLKVEDEDCLYDLISRRIPSDSRFFELFALIRMEFVWMAKLIEYIDLVENSFDCFTVSHWKSLRSRLILPVNPRGRNGRIATREFQPNPSSPLSGIIAHLTTRFGGNVHDKDLVRVTPDREWDSSATWAAKNIVDLGSDSCFCSANAPNQSIRFDFQSRRVKPTHYTIRSNEREPNVYHLKNWAIEGSSDGNSWIEVDCRSGLGRGLR
jgi:hypothetical protein